MSIPRSHAIEQAAFANKRGRIERFYHGRFLAANACSALAPCAYPYRRERRHRLREPLLERDIDMPDKLCRTDVVDVGCDHGTHIAWPDPCTGIDRVPQQVETARAGYGPVPP